MSSRSRATHGRSFRDRQRDAERQREATTDEQDEILRLLMESFESKCTRVVVLHVIKFAPGDWIVFFPNSAEHRRFQQQFVSYLLHSTPRIVSREGLSVDTLEDGESAYQALSRATRFLTQIYFHWYIVIAPVDAVLRPPRHLFSRMADVLAGGSSHRKRHFVEYRLIVDTELSQTLRNGEARRNRIFKPVSPSPPPPPPPSQPVPTTSSDSSASSSDSSSSSSSPSVSRTSVTMTQRSDADDVVIDTDTDTDTIRREVTALNNGRSFTLVTKSPPHSRSASASETTTTTTTKMYRVPTKTTEYSVVVSSSSSSVFQNKY